MSRGMSNYTACGMLAGEKSRMCAGCGRLVAVDKRCLSCDREWTVVVPQYCKCEK